MNKKLSLFVMFLLISTSLCFAVLSKNDAENLLLSSIVHDRIGQVDVYLYDELMPLNENVACTGFTVLTPYNSNWVAFIDEAPAFGWAHPCTYVFINCETGQFQLHQDQRPIRNLSDYDKISSINYIANNDIDVPPGDQTTNRPSNEHIYAVLINAVTSTSGGAPTYLRFWNELSAMFTTLVYEYGCPRDHIKVLSTNATDAANFAFSHAGIPYRGRDLDFRRDSPTPSIDIQYNCNISNLTTVFSSLGSDVESDDVVMVFLTGHGEYDNDNGFTFRTWNDEWVDASMFNNLLDNLNNCKQVSIVATGCHSGGLINGVNPITGHNRTVITSCDSYESEPAELWHTPVNSDPASGYGEFAYYFISALRGRYPVKENIDPENYPVMLNQPWADGTSVGSYNFPGFPLTPSPHPSDIDYRYLREDYWNNTGEPLLFRAFQYADIWDTISDQELMEEGLTQWPNYLRVHQLIGNPNYRAHPQYYSNGCLYRDRQTLDNINLNLSGYQIRDNLSFFANSLSLNGVLSVSGSYACLSLEDNSTLTMTPNSQINVLDGAMLVNNSIVTMQTSAVLNLEKASATFDHSRLNMNSSSINMRRYWYPDSNSSILFTNNSLLHAVSGASGNSQITGNAPATYVENVVNAGTNYANHIGSETLVRGDFVEFRNSIFETYGSDTHRFRIKSNQTQDPDNPTFWDGIYFYDCVQDFIDNPFRYVNIEYVDKILFNNSELTLDQCNISNSGQLVVENNSSIQLLGSDYENNEGPVYVSYSAIDMQNCEIQNNRLGGVYLHYPSTSQGQSSIVLSTIHDNGLHGIRTSNCILYLHGTTIADNDGQGIYNFSNVAPFICSGVQIHDNVGSEIFATDAGFPVFNPSGAFGINHITDSVDSGENLDQYYLMALGAPQDGSIYLRNTTINLSDQSRFYPDISRFTFSNNLLPEARILSNSINLLTVHEYVSCMDSLKQIIDIYPETKEAKTALGLLPYVDKAINEDNTSLIQYLGTISDEFLEDAIIDSKILSFIYNKDYITAINNLESIIHNPPSDYKLLAAMLDEAYCYYLSTIEGKGNILECTVMPKNRIDYNAICVDLQSQLNEFSVVEYSSQNFANHSIEVSNYPNPFNPTTTLSFSLTAEMVCNLEIYNVRGQKVKSLFSENKLAGRHSVVWDGKDDNGRYVSSGVYFYRLTTPNTTKTFKMLLMK